MHTLATASAGYPLSSHERSDPETTGLRSVIILLYLLAGVTLLLSPVMAFRWSRLPFPGFLVEHTLIVPDIGSAGWSGRLAGLGYPHRVVQVGDQAVNTPDEYKAIIASLSIGQVIQIHTVKPDGSSAIFPAIRVTTFPPSDFLRLFWLPYGIAVAYFGMGLLVLRKRSGTRPGRAFAFFCACAALAASLIFNLSTTHAASNLWPVAISLQGASLLSLAMFFPEASDTLKRYPRLRYLPYLVSLLVVVTALSFQNNPADPWAYVRGWQISYFYASAGILIFLGMAFYRHVRSASPVVRQQARVILWGSAFAFLPLGFWFAAPVFNLSLEWNPAIFLPGLLIFPLAIGIAITRYRLWDLDTLLNRTLVYGLLTALLGLVYYLSVFSLENLFMGRTAQRHPLIIAGITLVLALLFSPIRQFIQRFIDRRFFRQKYDLARTIASFGATIRNQVNLERLSAEMISIVQRAIQPSHVDLLNCIGSEQISTFSISPGDPLKQYLLQSNGPALIRDLDLVSPGLEKLRQQQTELGVPLISQGELVGVLTLGPRLSEEPYAINDLLLLNMLASQAAPALRVAQLVHLQQEQALERQRMETELRVAHLIQNTLIPQKLPELPGWQFSGYYQPAREVGGDYYDFIQLPDGRLGVVIGDATDKGVPAALVMATARSLLRTAAREMERPARVLERANALLHSHIPANMFVTCLYAIIAPDSGRFIFANAGHNLPYLGRNGSIQKLHATGLPLGIFDGSTYDEVEADLLPGDCLFLYSDGLVEAHNSQGEMLGFEGLARILSTTCEAGDLVAKVMNAYRRFADPLGGQEDDIALVIMHRGELIPISVNHNSAERPAGF